MKKTHLLLVFGNHGNVTEQIKGDRPFFRQAIVPFLEKHVVQEGKKAVVIEERAGYLQDFTGVFGSGLSDVKRILEAEGRLKSELLRELGIVFRRIENGLNSNYESSVNRGLQDPLGWHDPFGFMEAVLGMNRRKPNSVRLVVEPQFAEAALLEFKYKLALQGDMSENINPLKDYLESLAEFAYVRDRAVLAQVKELVKIHKQIIVIIPRGVFHSGMRTFFNPGRFRIDARNAFGPELKCFQYEACQLRYKGNLDQATLIKYALLQGIFRIYLMQQGSYDIYTDFDDKRRGDVITSGKEFATAMLSDIRKEDYCRLIENHRKLLTLVFARMGISL